MSLVIEPAAPLAAEDQARAEHYAILSRLFARAPDPAWLTGLPALAAHWSSAPGALGLAWQQLATAAREHDAESIDDEYTRLFLTIGRPAVMLYGSYYQAGFLMEEPLVELRRDLAELGISRRQGIGESEDHFAALAEVMRHLILGGSDPANLARQKAFFIRHLAPWVDELAQALESAEAPGFYARTAPLLRAFFAVERLAFDLVD